MIRQLRFGLVLWLMFGLVVLVLGQDDPQIYTFESGVQFTMPADSVLDDSSAIPQITLSDIALIDVVDPTVLGQTPDATLNMPLTDVLDFLLTAVGYEEARIVEQTIELTLLDGREALAYTFINASDATQLIFVIRLSDGRVGALNIRSLDPLPQEQVTIVSEMANSLDIPSGEAALVESLTQEHSYETGVSFRFPEEFIIENMDAPPVSIGIEAELLITMVDPNMIGMPAGETMEDIIDFAVGSTAVTAEDFVLFDIGGREAVIGSAEIDDLMQSMALVRFDDGTIGIMDIVSLAELTDEEIDYIRRVAASFNSSSSEFAGVTRDDFEQALALFEQAMTLREEGDNETAIDLFTQALDLDPDMSLGHFWRAATYSQVGQLEDAIAGYRKTLELEPEQVQIHADIADTYALLGDVESAIGELETYIDTVGEDEADPEALQTLEVYQQIANGEYNEDFYFFRANRLRQYRLFEEALESNQVTIDNNPEDADLYAQRGVIYTEMESYPEAIDVFTDGLEIELMPILFYNRGYAYSLNALEDLNAMINGVHDYQCLLLLADESITQEQLDFAEQSINRTIISSDDYEPITDPANCIP